MPLRDQPIIRMVVVMMMTLVWFRIKVVVVVRRQLSLVKIMSIFFNNINCSILLQPQLVSML